jgi:putative transcriptional regulator
VEVPVKNKLRVLRAEKNWSQSKLADLAGVSRQTIHAVETEKYDPSLPLAFKFAEIFNLRIEDLFEPTDK